MLKEKLGMVFWKMEQSRQRQRTIDRNVGYFFGTCVRRLCIKLSICALDLLRASVSLLLKALECRTMETTGTAGGRWLPSPLEQRLHWADT